MTAVLSKAYKCWTLKYFLFFLLPTKSSRFPNFRMWYIRIRTNSFIRYSLGNSEHCWTTKGGSFRVKSLATPLLPITLEKRFTICSLILATYSMNSSLGTVRPPYVLVGDLYPWSSRKACQVWGLWRDCSSVQFGAFDWRTVQTIKRFVKFWN